MILEPHKPKDFLTGNLQCDGYSGPCPDKTAVRQRQNTSYPTEGSNYVTMCPECAAGNADYWDERWAEYYGDRL